MIDQTGSQEFDLDESMHITMNSIDTQFGHKGINELELKDFQFEETVRYDSSEVDEITAMINSKLNSSLLHSTPVSDRNIITFTKLISWSENSRVFLLTKKHFFCFEMLH
jgi:hypothetical protein